MEGSEREGVGKRKRKEKKRKRERERIKKGKGGGERKATKPAQHRTVNLVRYRNKNPKKNLAPALTRRGARDFGFAKARVNQSNGQVTFSGVLPPCSRCVGLKTFETSITSRGKFAVPITFDGEHLR